MTADFTRLLLMLAAIPVFAAIASFFYLLGYRHGRDSLVRHPVAQQHDSDPPEPKPAPRPSRRGPEIPTYRINELVTLLELGILTPEEFELEKSKLYAPATAAASA